MLCVCLLRPTIILTCLARGAHCQSQAAVRFLPPSSLLGASSVPTAAGNVRARAPELSCRFGTMQMTAG